MYIIIALLVLSFLVIIHEGGHYLAARACHIEVQEFSVGMGPLLFQRENKNGTFFSLRLLPIGGFCAFYDEDMESDDPRAFNKQALWKRAITVASGPLMNFVIAFLAIVIYLSCVGYDIATNKVAAVEANAENAGLQIGDVIIAVNGKTVENVTEISAAISESNGETVSLSVQRGNDEVELNLAPFYDEALGRWRVGFTFALARYRISILESIPVSFTYNFESATLILQTLQRLVFHGEGLNDVTGPVGTVVAMSEITQSEGANILLQLMAIISVNLGVINLLPIPGLDGSRLLFMIPEAILHRPVKRNLEGAIHLVGFVFLMALMVLLTYKDILSLVTGGK